jgi:hypothetical protein
MKEFNINDAVIINEKGQIGTICAIGYVRNTTELYIDNYEFGIPSIWGMKSRGWISAEIINTLNKDIIRDEKIEEIICS